ncbi:hypothetical protein J2S09_001278 [Bacillus fengqiuensis]|nr:hypothetical protein [Bacillus fengqiuensis]
MHCTNCGHLNEGGKFCVKCGTKLEGGVYEQRAAAGAESTYVNPQPTTTYSQPAQQSQHVETAKVISKLYIAYFMQGVKNPTMAAQSVRGEQFINGIITMILYAISIPLMVYFGFKDFMGPFSEAVIQPAFYYLIFIAFVALATFAAVKLGRVQASLQDVFARFGTFLIVPTSFLMVALLLSLVQIEIFLLLLLFGFLGLFLVVPFTIYSFKKEVPYGLDGIYGTFLTYLAIIILLATIARIIIEQVMDAITDWFGFGLF